MTRAYDEIIDFIAAGATSAAVAGFASSEQTKERVADLVYKEKSDDLTPEESSELDSFMQLEHLMRLAKARARSRSVS